MGAHSEDLPVGLPINPTLTHRLERLFARDPAAEDLPGFRDLSAGSRTSKDHPLRIHPELFDAVASVWYLLQASPLLNDRLYDQMLDIIVSKIRSKGGVNIAPRQIQDIAYEGHIYLLLIDKVPGIKFNLESLKGAPDLTFTVAFQLENVEERIAIECKNISSDSADLLNLVRKVTAAISEASRQHTKRPECYRDLFIFIDLPNRTLLRRGEDYLKLCINVQRQLALQGIETVDEARVLYTAFCQRDMCEIMVSDGLSGGALLRPVITSEPIVTATRAVFLSFFFRESGHSANIFNFGSNAVRVDNPKDYHLG